MLPIWVPLPDVPFSQQKMLSEATHVQVIDSAEFPFSSSSGVSGSPCSVKVLRCDPRYKMPQTWRWGNPSWKRSACWWQGRRWWRSWRSGVLQIYLSHSTQPASRKSGSCLWPRCWGSFWSHPHQGCRATKSVCENGKSSLIQPHGLGDRFGER